MLKELLNSVKSVVGEQIACSADKCITKHNKTTPDSTPSPLHGLFGTSVSIGFIEDSAKNILGNFLKLRVSLC
jgi:hypothetical protein